MLRSSINITPLVDVVLVLLIIFIVLIPVALLEHTVALPPERGSVTDAPSAPSIVLAISEAECPAAVAVPPASGLPAGCRVRLAGEALDASALDARLADVFRNRRAADRVLFVAADENLNYESVVRLVDGAKRAVGRDLRIAIATDANGKLVHGI